MSAPAPLAPTITTVVTTIDDRPASERAVPVAAALAATSGATVELLSVDPVGLSASRSQRRLDEVVRQVPLGVEVTSTVLATTDSVADALGRLDRGPGAVLCIATHGRGAVLSLALGSVTAHLVRHTHLPVLAVGPGCAADVAEHLDGPAVAGVDGGPLDEEVLDAAALWARSTGAPIVVTTTITTPGEPRSWTSADEVLHRAEARLRRLEVPVTTSLIAASDVDEGILRALDGPPGCIVVGSHRRGPLGRMVLGSTATQVARRAACPVLVAAPRQVESSRPAPS